MPESVAAQAEVPPPRASTTRRLGAAAATAAVAVLVVLGYAYLRAPRASPVKVGDRLPDLALRSIVGESTERISSFGGKPLFVVFFDTRWPSSPAYIPHIDRLYRRYLRRNLMVVGIALDEDRAAAERFLEANTATFPVLWDPGARTAAAAYGVPNEPIAYLLDPEGRVQAVYPKALDWRRPEVREQIEKHLAPTPPGW